MLATVHTIATRPLRSLGNRKPSASTICTNSARCLTRAKQDCGSGSPTSPPKSVWMRPCPLLGAPPSPKQFAAVLRLAGFGGQTWPNLRHSVRQRDGVGI
jgi:hypothetical protein